MKILSVTKRPPVDDNPRQCVTLEAVVADVDGRFTIDFAKIRAALMGVVPFQRRFGNHVMPGIAAAELPVMLLTAAGIGANEAEVGRDDYLRYFIGVDGIAEAWDVHGPDDRTHLWRAEAEFLSGPVPRKRGRAGAPPVPMKVALTFTVETMISHPAEPMATIIKLKHEMAVRNLERALRKKL